MFLEIVSAMQKYMPNDTIVPYVVSKTGQLGRESLVNLDLATTYGVNLNVLSYEAFAPTARDTHNSVIFHHVLGHTKNIEFNKTCKYFVVNHTVTNIHRLADFKCNGIVSVCKYFAQILKKRTGLFSHVILNGCEDYFAGHKKFNGEFIVGCCQRVVPSKFNTRRKNFPQNCVRHVVGPCSVTTKGVKGCHFFGPVFDRTRKLEILRNFDVYLHDTMMPEGASMALLEALSNGIPVLAKSVGGGTQELIRHGINGYFYTSEKDLYNLLRKLTASKEKLRKLQESTREDFLSRLHVKHNINKYRKLYER